MAKGMKSGLSGRLRQLRKQNGWTPNQVSEMTALATSTLSKLENNQTSLTEDIRPIGGRRASTRYGETRPRTTPNHDTHYHAADLSRKRMAPIFVGVKARGIDEFGELE